MYLYAHFATKKQCVHLNNKVKKLLKVVLYVLVVLNYTSNKGSKQLKNATANFAFSLFTASIMRLRSVETVLSYRTWFYDISSR